ncbi:MAG TPA: methyltransferase domain-containing protein [Candidatus Elarobacter sp.]|nr:methyltransferase domain-containing protein [Candidatus Elarobacter sp.]
MSRDAFAGLRVRLVAHLRARGDVRTERVAAAFARVPRHVFVPGLSAEDVYADRSIAIKLEDGIPISSSSQPAIMAEMLEMLALREGDRVLEIGAGSGYNAALIAELVGPRGFVETIDLDDDLIAAARRHLDDAGYPQVHTLLSDGAQGDPGGAQFDAIIASVGVERIPPAWIAQVRTGGRLVAPLTVRAMQKVVAFERTANGLESRAIVDAGFMMLRGPSATSDSVSVPLGDPSLTLRAFAERAAGIDPAAVLAALHGRSDDELPSRRMRVEDVWNGFSLWLAMRDDAFCRLTAQGSGAQAGIVPNLSPGADSLYGFATTFGLYERGELVAFAPRSSFELTVRRFGAHAGGLARMQSAIAAWDDAGRPGNAQLRIAIDLGGTAHAELRG